MTHRETSFYKSVFRVGGYTALLLSHTQNVVLWAVVVLAVSEIINLFEKIDIKFSWK